MKMSAVNRVIVAMLAVAALAIGFWALILAPKRKEASELGTRVSSLKESLAVDRQQVDEALLARKEFAADYGQLVVLGKAVPADDDTASLLVQIDRIAEGAGVRFQEIALSGSDSEAAEPAPAPATEAPPGATEAPAASSSQNIAAPTEAAAATMPLGATIGPAGLGVMPYTLKFTGDFARVSDFIHGLDRLVRTTNSKVSVDGRLITVDAFSLGPQQEKTFPHLEAIFAVTTYLTPEGQGVTAGATPAAPTTTTATPAAAITGATP
jgi:Tfp pilus assembly protein PilO